MKREFVALGDLVSYHGLWNDFLNGLQMMISGFIYFDKLISLIKKIPSQGDLSSLGSVLPSLDTTITTWLNVEEVRTY